MTSIPTDYLAATTYAVAQPVAGSQELTANTAGLAQPAPASSQPGDGYASQAYQITLSDAGAASQNMQAVQSQNHLIEQMNAGFGNDEV